MLVLTRRRYEQLTIQLGEETVVVRVVDVGRDRVRLGIIAPKSVAVHREEVARRIAQTKVESFKKPAVKGTAIAGFVDEAVPADHEQEVAV